MCDWVKSLYAQERVAAKDEEVKNLKDQLNADDDLIKALDEDNRSLKDTIAQLRQSLEEHQIMLKKRYEKTSELESELEEWKNQCDSLAASENIVIAKLQEENDRMHKQNIDQDVIIENQKYQLAKWATENQQLIEEIEALKVFARRYLAV